MFRNKYRKIPKRKNCEYFRTEYLGKYLALKDTKTGEWRKLHSVKLQNLYGNVDIITLESRRL